MPLSKIKRFILNILHRPNKNAILLFGLNKSGTSVTINLIAKRTGLTLYDDFPYKLGDFDEVLEGRLLLTEYVNKHSFAFSNDLIRFPIMREARIMAQEFFNQSVFLLTIRNPVDNTKSLLSRLKIPGNLDKLDVEKLRIHSSWKRMLSKDDDYIKSLALCWKEAYQQFYPLDEKCVLFKYEDFKKDKMDYITQKVIQLGLEPQYPINKYVDIQYQPKGKEISNEDFFGNKNLNKINEITGDLALKFGYR